MLCVNATLTVYKLDAKFKNLTFSAITRTNKEKTSFFYADLFSPPISTLTQALNKAFLKTWPRIDIKYCLKEADDY